MLRVFAMGLRGAKHEGLSLDETFRTADTVRA